ncbi:MAG: thiopurine S-methyltransferase [Proteobacteria bacterium]|nr:thiopurine S-methyltransferase [Pseudomonadota bacterium]
MTPEFWLHRWAAGQTGWHHAAPQPALCAHWQRLALRPGAPVFVPLCGASADLVWLADQGHQVLGVELAEVAVQRFFAGQGLVPEVEGNRWRAGPYTLWCGDLFALPPSLWAGCAAVYDRAAWVALPPIERAAYAQAVFGPLAPGAQALLLTLDYDQTQRAGPPFAMPDAEVLGHLAGAWQIERLAREDVLAQEPKFAQAGVTALHESVFHLTRTAP